MPSDRTDPHAPQPTLYEIRVGGHLDPTWDDWLPGLAITPEENGTTLLTGPVADQAALHGLLRRVRDLGVPLLSVNRATPGRAHTPTEPEED